MGARKKAAASRGGNKIGVIYARFSSHAQREESIEQQVERCQAYAQRNNLNVTGGVYADFAMSGRTDRRPEFQRMMADAEAGAFDYVIAWKSNRMGRNMMEAMQNIFRLNQLGVVCYYTEEDFADNAAGRFAQRSMMNVNQFYSESMSEDIRRGIEYNASQCRVNGPIAWGYKRGEDGKYAIDPEKAPIVREIFQRVAQGELYMDIARDLNNRGIRTRSGEWNKGSFHRMLKNEAYIGVYKHSGYRIEGGVPPIIDKEVWDEVHEIISQPAKRGAGTSGEFILTGMLYCGDCNSPMVGISGTSKSGKQYYYYSCNKQRLTHECERKPLPRDALEDAVMSAVYEAMDDDVIQWMVEATVNYGEKIQEERGLPKKKELLAAEKKIVRNINDAICEGVWSSSTAATLQDIEELVHITLGERHILFEVGNTELICRRLEGDFLDYKNAIPRRNPIGVVVETKAMLESLERVSVVISEKLKSPVRCLFEEDRVTLSAKTANGDARDVCRIAGDGGALEIGFNNRYLMDALRYAPADAVKIELNTSISPAILVPVDGEEHFLYMVLPVRLKAQ